MKHARRNKYLYSAAGGHDLHQVDLRCVHRTGWVDTVRYLSTARQSHIQARNIVRKHTRSRCPICFELVDES